MNEWKIKGGKNLQGTIEVSGAKNSVLKLLCASILGNDKVTLQNVPELTDVENLITIIKSLGLDIDWNKETKEVFFDNHFNMKNTSIDPTLAGKLRASFLVAGALLGKYGYVRFPLPGGCSIGQRPIDLHLKAFETLGATWKIEHGEVIIEGNLRSGTIFLDFPSVGATENALLTAVSVEGKTTILNAAEEPEIYDLVNFLNSMGADIRKENGKTWAVYGGKELKGSTYKVMQDRIEAGTWLVLSALTDGQVKVKGVPLDDLSNVISKYRENGVHLYHESEDVVYLKIEEEKTMTFQTGPHPSFPTDMQPQSMLLASQVPGMHILVETVFENRYQHIPELMKMGCNIGSYDKKIAVVYGGTKLTGARVKSTDLRAGAALVLAGLFAEGTTVVENVYHIERGYEQILSKLQSIGADISVETSVR